MNWFAAPVLISACYHAIALIAGARRVFARSRRNNFRPPVSILKPIRGADAGFYKAIESHARQRYPEFEILFGVRDPDDGALPDIRRLIVEFPHVPMRIVTAIEPAPNEKTGALAALAGAARHSVLLVNDSDITVEPGYLNNVVAPLHEPSTGLVTCLYRASAASFPARCEALGIATDFAPSVLVARLLGIAEFALGSTMVFRAADLRRIGGFEAFAEYLADDYQLGMRIARLGLRVALADAVVETHLGAGTWRDVWKHQVRWSRTVRVSRTSGYYGYIATQTSFWALVACLGGAWRPALAAVAVRILAGVVAGTGVLRDRHAARYWWLIPFRDLFGFAVWAAGLTGSTVEWREKTLRLSSDGRIE